MNSLWNDTEAQIQPELGGLVYSSRLVGADTDLVVWGGGNTSAKLAETDFRGRPVRVLRVKGSGSDLKTIQVKDFPGVRLDDDLALRERSSMSDEEMVAYLAHTLQEPGSPRPSIETLLHAFIPATFVVHTHADAILALTNTPSGERWVREVLGEDALWIPYQRPGFALSKLVAEAYQASPGTTCAVMEKHGLITWGETAREAYERTVEMVTRAEGFVAARAAKGGNQSEQTSPPAAPPPLHIVERGPGGEVGAPTRYALDSQARRQRYAAIAPLLRGLAARTSPDGSVAPRGSVNVAELPPKARVVMRFDDSAELLAFASDPAARELTQVGPATPDHLITTKRTALYVPVDGASASETDIAAALKAAWKEWAADYMRYVDAGSPNTARPAAEQVDPRPRVVLLPGIGVVTLGRDAKAARQANEVHRHAVRVMRAASTLERYESLSAQDCFDVEYWPLELYKLTLAPPEAELSRRIALVTGAASGIGRAIAERLAADGAHVTISDVNLEGAQAVADQINARHGEGHALAVRTNVADEADAARAFVATVEAFGGLDVLVSNAGVAPFAPIDEAPLADWQRAVDVNATGHFLMVREALRLFKRQGMGGNVICVATKNVTAPGKEFGAYSASKAAQTQLARVAALEGGEHGIRVNMINPDAVFRGSSLWSPELRLARAQAHGVSEEDLGDFYRQRCLLGVPIYPEDVAEAAWFLASERSAKMTGGVLTVDGGVPAAFPR